MHILVTEILHDIFFKILSKTSLKVDVKKDISYEELFQIIDEYDGIVIRSNLKIDKNLLEKVNNLKFIARLGSGLENIDIEYTNKKNIICINTPEGNRNSVAEQCIGMLLCLLHKIHLSNQSVKKLEWNRFNFIGTELENKTIGIIGFGNTGMLFAKKLLSFNVNILAYDKYKKNFSNYYVKESSLEEIKEYSDIISIHLPLTNETENLINKEFINSVKKNFYLINTSRGKIVNTFDLYNSLIEGKILGAILDVIEFETSNFKNLNNCPDYFIKMVSMPNVLITPHTAGLSEQSLYKMSFILAKKILNIFEQLHYPIYEQ